MDNLEISNWIRPSAQSSRSVEYGCDAEYALAGDPRSIITKSRIIRLVMIKKLDSVKPRGITKKDKHLFGKIKTRGRHCAIVGQAGGDYQTNGRQKSSTIFRTLFTSVASQSTLWLMNDPAKQREALEDLWGDRLQEAQARYKLAKAICAKASQECANGLHPIAGWPLGISTGASNRDRRASRVQYTLEVFHDLTVNGKMPPE